MGQQAVERAALTLEDLDDLVGQLVDVGGRECLEQRLEPVEQHRQVERRLGARDRDRRPLLQRVRTAHSLAERDVALTDEVAVADLRHRAVGDGLVVGDLERDQRAGAVVDVDLLHVADLDAGDPHVIALHHAGGVAEDRLVLLAAGERDVADRDHEQPGRQGGDDDEDDQLDGVAGGLLVEHLHRRLTRLPRASGPNSRDVVSGTCLGGTPIAGPANELMTSRSAAVPA